MALALRMAGEIQEGHLLIMQEALSEAAVEGLLSKCRPTRWRSKKRMEGRGRGKLMLALVPFFFSANIE